MKLLRLTAKNYRSIREETVEFSGLDVFIGANASGKSTIIDALRFLQEAIQTRTFRAPMYSRGGILNLAWKGEEANRVELRVAVESGETTFEWSVALQRDGYAFTVEEQVERSNDYDPPATLLQAGKGDDWWVGKDGKVQLARGPMDCALASASADASFPAREFAEFIGSWAFADPNPFLLRRDWSKFQFDRLDPYGRNLAETLHRLSRSGNGDLERIRYTTRIIVGHPMEIEPRETEEGFYFVQKENGLQFPVNQMGASSGTLRMLAIVTALLGKPKAALIGIEEPENYLHPGSVYDFVQVLLHYKDRAQFVITTHSPLFLNCLDIPEAVSHVRRDPKAGTKVIREPNPAGVRMAIEKTNYGLGEIHDSSGFGYKAGWVSE